MAGRSRTRTRRKKRRRKKEKILNDFEQVKVVGARPPGLSIS